MKTLHDLSSRTLAEMHGKLRWLALAPTTPHELSERQLFCDSLDDLLARHKEFVGAAETFADVLGQFDCAMDAECSAAFYSSVYLPKLIVDTVHGQQPLLQQLLRKFVDDHQQQLAGFLADLQQTEIDVRQFHSFGDLDRTEAYAPAHSRAVFL